MRDQHQTSVGSLIKALREQLGWSQRQLAREVGLDQSALSRIEKGGRQVSALELQRFADVFRVSADTLLAGDTEAAGAAAPGSGPVPPGSPSGSFSPAGTPSVHEERLSLALEQAAPPRAAAPSDVLSSARRSMRPMGVSRAPSPASAAPSGAGIGPQDDEYGHGFAEQSPAQPPEGVVAFEASLVPPGPPPALVKEERLPEQAASIVEHDDADGGAVYELDRTHPDFVAALPSAASAFEHTDLAARGRRAALPADWTAPPAAAGDAWPQAVATVVRDWFALRDADIRPARPLPWSLGLTADGRSATSARPWRPEVAQSAPGDVLYDRAARFWRSELHVDPDDGPLPDLVPLLEDALGIQVIVARVGAGDLPAPGDEGPLPAAADPARPPAREARIWLPAGGVPHPVAAAFVTHDVPFIFVNAGRPVVLQRYALAHAFAHLALAHGDVVDDRIVWQRTHPREAAANDFAEELLAPVRAVDRWYARHADLSRAPSVDTLLLLANAFGISPWAALFRSRAAARLPGRQFALLRREMKDDEWLLLPRQAFLGGVRDTLAHLTPQEVVPPGEFGEPAVLRVPALMRTWTLAGVRAGRLSLEDAAAALHLPPGTLARQLERLGVE